MVSNGWEAWGWVGVGLGVAMSGIPPQIAWINVTAASGWAQGRAMPMTLAYAIALADARSCLAALADAATDFDESGRYERLLIDLDGIHAGDFPATYPMCGTTAELLARLEAAVDRMIELGGDALSLELFIADVVGPITDP